MDYLHRNAAVLTAHWDRFLADPLFVAELDAFATAVAMNGAEATRLELGGADYDQRTELLAQFVMGFVAVRGIERDRMEHEPAEG